MTEENFFDMFNRVHNPDYYYGKQKKTKEKKTSKKTSRKKQADGDEPKTRRKRKNVDDGDKGPVKDSGPVPEPTTGCPSEVSGNFVTW